MRDPDPGMLQKQKEEQKTIDIRQELTQLQNWDVREGQTLEERRAEHAQQMIQDQIEDNLALQSEAERRLAQAQAQAAAPGAPVQEQAPAKKTFKQRQADKRHAKEARKQNPEADHISYAAQQQLQELAQAQLNSFTPERREAAERGNVDCRVLRVFSQGYRKDKKGRPASEEDARRKAEDDAFLDDYISKDIQRRRPHLERFTQEMLAVKVSPDMLTDAYLEQHTVELKVLCDRMVYFENIQKDPINAPFFETMDPLEKDLLDARVNTIYAAFSSMLVNRLAMKGVNCDHGAFLPSAEQVNFARQMDEGYSAILTQTLEESARKEREAIARHTNRAIEAEMPELMEGAQSMKEQVESTKELEDLKGLNLTSFVTGYSFDELSNYRSMIEKNPEKYADYKPILDDLYQGLYRGMDSLGDLNLRMMACQSVCDKKKDSDSPLDQLLVSEASKEQEAIAKQADLLRDQFAAYADAVQFFLRDKPLSDPAKRVLQRVGNPEALAKRIFQGPGGAIENSDKAYNAAEEKEDVTPAYIRSSALTALGIRSSKSDAGFADKLIRGTTYIGIKDDIALYFHELEDEQNINMNDVSQQIKRTSAGASAFNTGGGIENITMGILDLFSRYATSPESIQYFNTMVPLIKDAKVFGGDPAAAVDYLTQGLVNSYGADYQGVDQAQDTYVGKENTRKVALEACRTLLCVTKMTQYSEEEKNALPESVQEILEKYQNTLRNVIEKMNEKD